ncbi:hypothetical protein NDN08_003402 [Rhodosorus marinus]|uniref:peptidylprolyl isomerase n=1 Tax=Rhodosorus marinus TaxID=101924 RepID=A0AAV8UWE0_9RHOD|nr:hypothetical protein NDN08_003402 [Rhodosorus marinus]
MSEAFVGVLPGCGRVSRRSGVVMCSEKPEGGFSRRRAMELAGGSVLGVVLGGSVQGGVKDAEAMSLKRLKMGPPIEIDDGVVYREIKTGDGYSPNQGDTVAIHYSLFCDGIEVETSRESQGLAARPLAFTWGATRGPGAILKGVPMGMDGMKVGGQRMIILPPELAYGAKGRPPLIPPNSNVEFAVSLLSVKRMGSNPNVSSLKNSVY